MATKRTGLSLSTRCARPQWSYAHATKPGINTKGPTCLAESLSWDEVHYEPVVRASGHTKGPSSAHALGVGVCRCVDEVMPLFVYGCFDVLLAGWYFT